MITIKNLNFNFGSKCILNNISMELEDGKIYGLLGKNEVGKTTLLSLLSGLKKANKGSIEIDGFQPYDREPDFLQQIHYLPDEVIVTRMKAMDFAKRQGVFWVNFSLEKFINIMNDFSCDTEAYMDKMSYGQLKKTYISFILACNTKYIFMDEPTNGLDIPSKSQFRKAVLKYTSENSTIIISTHQVRDLENIIDPIIILDKQAVLLNASLEEISNKLYFDYSNKNNPDALYVEQLPGSSIQVYPNKDNKESLVNIEALFNVVYAHKDLIKRLFNEK